MGADPDRIVHRSPGQLRAFWVPNGARGCRPMRFGATVCGARVRHLGVSRCSRTNHALASAPPIWV
jgi:hypothetical protein